MRKNPWLNRRTRAAMLRGIRAAAKRRREKAALRADMENYGMRAWIDWAHHLHGEAIAPNTPEMEYATIDYGDTETGRKLTQFTEKIRREFERAKSDSNAKH